MDVSARNGITIFWRIENFISRRNSFLQSPVFEIEILESNWQLGVSERIDGFLSTYLYKVTGRVSTFLDVSVSLLTGSGWNTISNSMEYRFKADGIGWGEDRLLTLENLKARKWFYMPSGSLTISFQIWNQKMQNLNSQYLIISRLINSKDLYHRKIETFSSLKPKDLIVFPASYKFEANEMAEVGHESKTEHIKYKELKTECTQTELKYDVNDADDLLKLIKEQKLIFITLRTPGKEFCVPKAVLSASSRIFADMIEKRPDHIDCSLIDIDDIDSDTMTSLIRFLLFDKLDDQNWDSTVKLFSAASKFEIDSMKKACVSLLKNELCVENICSAFVLANLHQDNELENCAMKYFCKNSKIILQSKEWNDFLLSHAELVEVILSELAETFLKMFSED